jgi:hypothetical protein
MVVGGDYLDALTTTYLQNSTNNNTVLEASNSDAGTGVRGQSYFGYGVEGVATRGSGVHGVTYSYSAATYGVDGIRSDVPGSVFGGAGVRGVNEKGDGVVGQGSSTATGVVGDGKFGVLGRSSDNAGFGLWGQHFGTGPAVFGHGVNGYGGMFEGARAQLKLNPMATAGKPTTGAHQKGEIYMDSKGALFVCTANGTPGTWRKVTTKLV